MLSFGASRRLHAQGWRLALAIAALTFLGMLLHDAALLPLAGSDFWRRGSFLLPAVMVGVASYWIVSRLQGRLGGLRPNAEAWAVDGSDAAAEMAYTDTITGLPNREVAEQMLARALDPDRDGEFRAAILFIGLDGLKQVHRAMGQDACNELLKQAGQRLLVQGLRRCHKMLQRGLVDVMGKPGDRLPVDAVLCHLAGGEFVAILPGHLDRAALALTCEGIINAMAEPFQVHSHEVRVEASVGIAMTPGDACNRVYLLAFAAQAMWAAQRSGKARYAFFDRQGLEGQLAQLQIEGELQHALARGELVLHYQPQVELDSCEQRAVEALVRWQHPVRGLLAPSAFIDAAERGGLMAELGRQVIEMAVTQCQAWLAEGLRLVVAVNVTPSQLTDPRFVEHVLGTLRQAAVPPELLVVEITESTAMTDFEATVQRLGQLRAAGVKVALDDFGIGFSNLSQLSLLPLDVLKIDRSLVQGIGQQSKSEAIICAIVGMTRALGCRSIAEGIGTLQQYEFLCFLGCDSGQGFLFAEPMSAEEVANWRCSMGLDLALPLLLTAQVH